MSRDILKEVRTTLIRKRRSMTAHEIATAIYDRRYADAIEQDRLVGKLKRHGFLSFLFLWPWMGLQSALNELERMRRLTHHRVKVSGKIKRCYNLNLRLVA
jgi:hypothetical protein